MYLDEHLHQNKDNFSLFPMLVAAIWASCCSAFTNSFKTMLTVIINSTSLSCSLGFSTEPYVFDDSDLKMLEDNKSG